jgi:hypothetical protein
MTPMLKGQKNTISLGRKRREKERRKKDRKGKIEYREREYAYGHKMIGNVKREKITKPYSKEEIHQSSTPEVILTSFAEVQKKGGKVT